MIHRQFWMLFDHHFLLQASWQDPWVVGVLPVNYTCRTEPRIDLEQAVSHIQAVSKDSIIICWCNFLV